MTQSRSSREDDGRSALIAVLALATAMILGGGGSPAPFPELAVQLIVGMLFSLWLIWFPQVPAARLRPACALAGLLVLVPLVQLAPLPPAVWHALPGRELERASLEVIGQAGSWRPLSMAPARTLNGLLALVPPAMVLLITGTLGPDGRSMAVGMIAGVSLLAIVVGAVQAAGGERSPLRFYIHDAGYLNGFQANHNASADVLLIGMVALAVAVQDWLERSRHRPSRRASVAVVLAGTGLMSIGVVLTASRTGTALLPVAWLGVYAATRPLWPVSAARLALGAAIAMAIAAASLFLLRENVVLANLIGRYTFGGELRPQIWTVSLHAARVYFPVGAGIGAFLPVFLAAEPLQTVYPAVPNRAHNDYLEFVIEAGAFGLVVLSVAAAILVRLAAAQLRQPSARLRRQAIFAVVTFTIVALHSLVDYPLRSIAMACLAATAAGLLVPVAKGGN